MTKRYVSVLVIYVVTHETQKETVIDKVPHYHVSDIPPDLNPGIPRFHYHYYYYDFSFAYYHANDGCNE